jgi:hypothetical protein
MSQAAFKMLRDVPQGRAILVNMFEELTDCKGAPAREAKLHKLRLYFSALAEEFKTLPSSPFESEIFAAANRAVWGHMDDLQRQGAPVFGRQMEFAVFRTLDQIKKILDTQAKKDNRIAPVARRCNPTGDFRTFNEDHGKKLSDAINRLSDDVPLCLSEFDEGGGYHFTVWYTKLRDYEELCEKLGDGIDPALIANACREWLGLGDSPDLMPLFVFSFVPELEECSQPKDCSNPAQCNRTAKCIRLAEGLCRPSVFDAINHKWFKYKRLGSYEDNWGRALHIGKFLRGSLTDLDGGPEAVGPASRIPGRFVCKYVGKLDGNVVTKWNEDLVKALAQPQDPDESIDALQSMLWPVEKARGIRALRGEREHGLRK